MSQKNNKVTSNSQTVSGPGRFITLEGGDGAGKSTHVNWLAEQLTSRGIDLVQTREPGGTELGENIRGWLLSLHNGKLSPICEMMLLFAARAQHLHERIRPALGAGKWVLCERYIDATYAYQGGGRGLPMQHIAQLEAMMLPEVPVDLTILFDLPPAVALQRKLGNKARLYGAQPGLFEDRFEKEILAFHERVRGVYRAKAQAEPERIEMIEIDKLSPAKVRSRLEVIIENRLSRWMHA